MKKKLTYKELEDKLLNVESKNRQLENLLNYNSNDKNLILKLFDTIPNPMFYKDINGIYQNCNDAFSKIILGIPKETIIGKTLFELPDVIPNSFAKIYHEKDKTLFEKRGSQFYEANVKCADNSKRTYLFYKATVDNDKGYVSGIIGVMLDITNLKETQDKLKEKNELFEKYSYNDVDSH